MNLAGNAVKFTERGQVRISAGVVGEDTLEVRVADTGPGIKEENMPLLFKPFQQVDGDIAKKHEGTGLGLHLCRKLLGLLGGDIRAESAYGAGSTFIFTLPLRHKETAIHEKDTGGRG
jgi:signal transduction histidine kinase